MCERRRRLGTPNADDSFARSLLRAMAHLFHPSHRDPQGKHLCTSESGWCRDAVAFRHIAHKCNCLAEYEGAGSPEQEASLLRSDHAGQVGDSCWEGAVHHLHDLSHAQAPELRQYHRSIEELWRGLSVWFDAPNETCMRLREVVPEHQDLRRSADDGRTASGAKQLVFLRE